MNTTPLRDFMTRHGLTQVRMAQLVGKTQAGIHCMLKDKDRLVVVIEHDDGTIQLESRRPTSDRVSFAA